MQYAPPVMGCVLMAAGSVPWYECCVVRALCRYSKIADSSKNFIITQYGISCFEQTGETWQGC